MNINIKGIKIENFRSIKEVEIDFFNNTNGIEEDLKLGRFKLTDDGKHAIANHYAIMGRNSIGKTTILEAISLVSDFASGRLGESLVLQVLQDALKSGKKLNPAFEGANGNYDSEEMVEEIKKSIQNEEGLYYEQFKKKSISFFTRFFSENSNDSEKNIKITISLFVGKKIVDATVIIFKNGIETLDISGEDEGDVVGYLSNIAITSHSYPFGDEIISKYNISNVCDNQAGLNSIFISIIKEFGIEKATRLIRLADVKIQEIVVSRFPNGREIIRSIMLKNGAEIDILDLSTGTRQFMAIIYQISRLLKNKKNHGLVLIDEIDRSLHSELVDALKVAMQIIFDERNYQFIFTTHNPMSLVNYTSKKQIISLFDSHENEGVIKAMKMSSILKPNQSILKAYINGTLSPYPDAELSRNTMVDIYYE